jgi:hypothetical protein
MSWPPALYVHAPGHPVTLDATLCGLADDEVLDLPFDAVFEAMTALEGGDYANPDERRQVGHFWLRAPHLAPTMVQARDIGEAVDAAARLAHEIRTGRMRGPDGRCSRTCSTSASAAARSVRRCSSTRWWRLAASRCTSSTTPTRTA